MIEKDRQVMTDVGVGSAEKETACFEAFPSVVEYVTATTYKDGSKRVPSTVMLFTQDGMWKAMLRDKDRGLCLWVAGVTVDDALAALEAGLTDARAVWRVDRAEEGGSAKRVKNAGRG